MTETPTTAGDTVDATLLWRAGHGAVHLGYADSHLDWRDWYARSLLDDAARHDWITTFATEAHRDWPATWHIDDDTDLLYAASRLAAARSNTMDVLRQTSFTPGPGNPLAAFVINTTEQGLLDPVNCGRAEFVMQIGRKVGVALVLIMPRPSLEQLGGSELIRAAVTRLAPRH
jgi:hypothetical protein